LNSSTALRVKAKRSPAVPSFATLASKSRTEAATRHSFDLCFDVTQLTLSISNCCVRRSLSFSEPNHLSRLLVLHPGAVERDRVAVQAIAGIPFPAQSGKRLRQLVPSPF
jgi:hypothetical protein